MALYDESDTGKPNRGGGSGEGGIGGTVPAPTPTTPTERQPGDFPCPEGQCKDVVLGVCRSPGKNEKRNETDEWERASGGGRGYCRQRDSGGGGGGGGAAGAAPKAAAGPSPNQTFNNVAGMFGPQAKSIWDSLQKVVDGGTRYSPEVMANLDSDAKLAQAAQASGGRRAANNDAILRGMGRSSNRDIGLADRGAAATFSRTLNQNRIRKVDADFTDRMQALDAQEKWLDSMQKHVATLDQTAATRERDQANIALGYARIAAERAMLTERIKGDVTIAGMNTDLAKWLAQFGLGA